MTDIRELSKVLEGAAPGIKLEEKIRSEREKIERTLQAVGEYVLTVDSGQVYRITSSANERGEE
jgi:hypothetical protein